MRKYRVHNKLQKSIIITSIITGVAILSTYILVSNIIEKNPSVTAVSINDDENSIGENNSEVISTNSEAFRENIKNEIIVVNREISMDDKYIPENLVVPNVATNKEIKVTVEVAKNLEELFEAAKVEGVDLIAVSGYRSYDYQKMLFDNSAKSNGLEHAKKYVALPGYSEHHTGLAVDVVSKLYTILDDGFEDTEEFKWLKKNMSDYGFILRYPRGKEDITGYNYEPWHLRYVGKYIAEDIEVMGITLEEYIIKD